MAGRDQALGLMGELAPSADEAVGFAGKLAAAPYNTAQAIAPNLTERAVESGKRMIGGGTVGIGGQVYGALQGDPRTMQSFQRDAPQEPTQLNPMATSDVNVQPVAPLDPRMSAFKSSLAGGGGPSTGGLAGLKAKWDAARGKILGDYETDKDLAGRAGVARADRIDTLSDLQSLDAAKKQRDAEIDQQAAEAASQKHQQMLERNQELADDIGRQKIDTNRLMRSTGTVGKVNHMFGSILAGARAGLQGGSNQFLARYDQQVDKEIAAQEKEIDNKKTSLSARMNLFGQMLQETGDRRLARMQTRNLMYEAAKQELGAQADKLGIPEVLVNADQAKQAFQHQQDALGEQYAKESYATAAQQAAAQAAAAKAAEEKLWQRTMQLNELGLKKDELEIKKLEAGKKAGAEDAQAIAETTKRLADDDIVKNRELIRGLARGVDPKTGEVVGLDKMSQFRNSLSSVPGFGLTGKLIQTGDEEKLQQQRFQQLALLYQTKVTGSGGSDAQMAAIHKAFQGAGSMAEKRAAIQMAEADLNRREGLAQANLTDSQKAQLQQRLAREGQTDMPSTVKVKP